MNDYDKHQEKKKKFFEKKLLNRLVKSRSSMIMSSKVL